MQDSTLHLQQWDQSYLADIMECVYEADPFFVLEKCKSLSLLM